MVLRTDVPWTGILFGIFWSQAAIPTVWRPLKRTGLRARTDPPAKQLPRSHSLFPKHLQETVSFQSGIRFSNHVPLLKSSIIVISPVLTKQCHIVHALIMISSVILSIFAKNALSLLHILSIVVRYFHNKILLSQYLTAVYARTFSAMSRPGSGTV